jgi:hypothetical protein
MPDEEQHEASGSLRGTADSVRFDGTGARFPFYFPPPELYRGRFFHNTYPLAFAEDVGPFPIAFDVATCDLGFTPRTGSTPPPRSTRGSSRANCSAVAALTGTCTAAAAAMPRVELQSA